jgi:hypothetical protein
VDEAPSGAGPRLVTPARGAASSSDAGARARHPLEDSDHLAWQATAAVRLLERFGAQLLVALDAVGRSDDPALDAALLERDRLVAQLEPLLAALAEARARVRDWPTSPSADSASQQALTLILAPVDDALQHAQLLHKRLADETRDVIERRTRTSVRTPAAVRRGGRGGAVALVR